MSTGFYQKIALQGITKNKRVYYPFILTGTVMVMMIYILYYLSGLEFLSHLKGGGLLRTFLPFGGAVVSVFALLFMFYSNSCIIRQRGKEFGLYNVLGMGKRNLRKIILLEGAFSGTLSLIAGLLFGIVFAKTAELILCNLLTLDISYALKINFSAVLYTALIYTAVCFVLMISSVIRVSRNSPLELLRSAEMGEKPPKANWVFAVIGVLILAGAYYIALSITQPLKALSWFFIAVLMVIIATYLLFISGSVAFCRLLQKNKKYYYKSNHFVSVSSMVYRMKRNGAGLASICVLMTMVLVTLSSTFSLYIGTEDSLRYRFPADIQMMLFLSKPDDLTEENFSKMRDGVDRVIPEKHNVREYAAMEVAGLLTDNGIAIDIANIDNVTKVDYDHVCYLSVIALDDYNRLTGRSETLEEDECLLYCYRTEYAGDFFTVEHCAPLKVKKQVDEMFISGHTAMQLVPTVILVATDIGTVFEPIASKVNSGADFDISCFWNCSFDVGGTPEDEIAAFDALWDHIGEIALQGEDGGYSYNLECREENRIELFTSYAGLLFVGVLLSIVFLFAAVLIIYYKQISEGYEDQKRFDVMQKVGMTKDRIKKSVNSQVLTVFFAPLLFAGLHLGFAFPMLRKVLLAFSFHDPDLMIWVTVACFVVFALIYAVVYRITSNVYYTIVSGGKDK